MTTSSTKLTMLTKLTSLTSEDEDTILAPLTSLPNKESDRRKRHKQRFPKRTWAGYALKDAKKRAEKKGVAFRLTRVYIESIIPDKCPVFGTPFTFMGNGAIKPESPALDRIIPSRGYIEGNIQIISVKANNIKSAYNSKDIFKVAEWLHKLEQEHN